jgi:hypothetical protein
MTFYTSNRGEALKAQNKGVAMKPWIVECSSKMETIKHLPFIASAKTTILLDIATNLDKNFGGNGRKK